MNGLSREARALIDGVANLDEPSQADKARIQKRLSMQLGAAAFAGSTVAHATGGSLSGTPSGIAGAPKSAWFGSLGKIAMSMAALAGVTAALVLGAPQKRDAARKPVPAETRSSSSLAAPAAVGEQEAVARQDRERPAAEATPVTPRAPEQRSGSAGTQRERAKPARPLATAKPNVSPADAPAEDTLGRELALLGRAQAALRAGKAQEALALAEEHAGQFPEGVMKQERMGVAALAECAVSRDQRAHARAFLKLAPSSPLATRVRKACGLE